MTEIPKPKSESLEVRTFRFAQDCKDLNKLPTTLRSGYSRLQTNPNWFAEWVIHPAT